VTPATYEPAPDVESPPARTGEQEIAGGRTGSTPIAVIAGVGLALACLYVVVLAFVVLAFELA
jgi:hypothetical protein